MSSSLIPSFLAHFNPVRHTCSIYIVFFRVFFSVAGLALLLLLFTGKEEKIIAPIRAWK